MKIDINTYNKLLQKKLEVMNNSPFFYKDDKYKSIERKLKHIRGSILKQAKNRVYDI